MPSPTSPSREWIATASAVLHYRWPTVELQRLDELAAELFEDDALRAMRPEEAARRWLEPVWPMGRAR